MASVGAWVALVVMVALHTLAAAVITRLLRVQLSSRWSPPLFALFVVPVVLVVSTILLSGGLGLGPDLGDPGVAMFVLVAVPLGLGLSVDYLWMPAPDAVELPAATER